ncbi:predicted protein [Micromonas commoda]|uniref:Vps41 beta-propeller domain-containing protein n=1 Tax=Micromonas commoda (strain RCC299 / NOUM17 / CCMP2709) TaxID=296587 RepID=C1EI68_MICCC|nr:predicted protein [Micromonas commoda]ACO67807.1 predicted protein [Micromonas commoda]|eukprot:XP_002506549.1 predicted protein [Micromonas commoda]
MEEPPDPHDPGEGPRVGDNPRADEDARSESGSDASTSGSESVSEDDDDEPMLKYQRLGGAVPAILSDDVASCACAGGNIIVLGTKRGVVIVLDRGGNELRRFTDAHRAPVNDVCLDARREWVGSCADDGTCAAHALYDDDDAHASSASTRVVRCEHDAGPVRSIALDPRFSSRGTRRFVRGGDDGSLVLSASNKNGGPRRDVVLHAGEGPVRRVRWAGTLIAWANDVGVKVYDEARDRRIAHVDRPRGSPPPGAYPPHIAWCDGARTLVIAWADCVKVAVVRTRTLTASERSGRPLRSKTTVARFVEVVAMFQTDYFVCGIAPFGPDRLVAFAFVDGGGGEAAGDAADGEASRAPSSRPEVRVLTWKNEDLTCDALTMKGYESFQAGDYHLAACVPDDDDRYDDRYDDASGSPSSDTAAYYLVSPRDVLVGKPRTVADRLRWLVEERGDYEAALEACDAAVASAVPAIPRRRVRDVIADAYLQSHLDAGDPARGASLCPRLLGTDALKWERWIARFAATPRALPHLAPYVPTEHPRLSTAAYERVLNAFLHDRRDHARFLATVKAWAPTIYSVPSMVSAVRRKMDTGAGGDSPTLREALAELYLADGQRDRALRLHLELGRPSVLDFVNRHGLLPMCANMEGTTYDAPAGTNTLARLARLDPSRAATMLADASFVKGALCVPAEVTVRALTEAVNAADVRGTRECLHLYLRELFKRDPDAGERWHRTQPALYAEFHPEELLNFLERANGYDLADALAVCERHLLLKEQVYLLSRVGDAPMALDVIVEGLRDAKYAVTSELDAYADELWTGLISRVVKTAGSSPALVGNLMDALGAVDGVDPRRVLAATPVGTEVEGARNRLRRILTRSRRAEREAEARRAEAERELAEIEAMVDAARRRAFDDGAVEIED